MEFYECPSDVARLHGEVDGVLSYKHDGIVTLPEIEEAFSKEQKKLQALEADRLRLGGPSPSQYSRLGKILSFDEAATMIGRRVDFFADTRRKVVQSGPLHYFRGCSLSPTSMEPTPGVCEGLSEIPYQLVDCGEYPAFRVHQLAGRSWEGEEYANFTQYLKESKGDYRGSVQTLNTGRHYAEISFPQKGSYQPVLALTAQDLRVILDYRELAREYQTDKTRYASLFRSRHVIKSPDGGFQIAGRKAPALEVWGLLQTEKFMKEFEGIPLHEATEEKRNKFRQALEDKGLIPLEQDWSGNLEGRILLRVYDQKDSRIKTYALSIPDLVTSKHFASQRHVTFDAYLQWIGNLSGLQEYDPHPRWKINPMSLEEGFRLREEKIENPE